MHVHVQVRVNTATSVPAAKLPHALLVGDKISMAAHAAPESSLGGVQRRGEDQVGIGKHGGIKQAGLGGAKEPLRHGPALVGIGAEEGGQGGEGLVGVSVDVVGVDPACSRGGTGPAGAQGAGARASQLGGGGHGQVGGQGVVHGPDSGGRAVLRAGYCLKVVWLHVYCVQLGGNQPLWVGGRDSEQGGAGRQQYPSIAHTRID